MIEFGNALKSAREAKGLTTSQVAQETHIMVQIVEDLEHNRFSRIPAPIYGRGFIKLYCGLLRLDPKPFIDEYMAVINGEHETPIQRIDPPPTPPTPPTTPTPGLPRSEPVKPVCLPVAVPVKPPEPADSQPEAAPLPQRPASNEPGETIQLTVSPTPARPVSSDQPTSPVPTASPAASMAAASTFRLESETVPKAKAFGSASPLHRPLAQTDAQPRTDGQFSRYASPLGGRPTRNPTGAPHFQLPFTLPPNLGRIAAVIAGALIIFWLLIVGVRALYRITMTPSGEAVAPQSEPSAPVRTESVPATPGEPATRRTPGEVPPLYID